MRCRGCRRLLAAALLLTVAAGMADAKTFRWANDGDANSMDPYARQETFLLAFDQSMYEPLVRRNREMQLEPALATEWARTEPTVWRFKLRQGVKFHDGTPFTADDVVFSFERATASRAPTSRARWRTIRGGAEDRRLHRRLRHRRRRTRSCPTVCRPWRSCRKKWCEEHNATRAADRPRTRRTTPPATPTAPGRSC